MKEEEEEQKEEGVGDWVITNYKEFKLFILFCCNSFSSRKGSESGGCGAQNASSNKRKVERPKVWNFGPHTSMPTNDDQQRLMANTRQLESSLVTYLLHATSKKSMYYTYFVHVSLQNDVPSCITT